MFLTDVSHDSPNSETQVQRKEEFTWPPSATYEFTNILEPTTGPSLPLSTCIASRPTQIRTFRCRHATGMFSQLVP